MNTKPEIICIPGNDDGTEPATWYTHNGDYQWTEVTR